MKYVSFIVLSFCILICSNVDAQCYFKKKLKKSYSEAIISDNCNVIPDIVTQPTPLINKFYGALSMVSFVKTGDDYYFYFYLGLKYMKRQQVLENNPLTIVFEDREPLYLYPCGSFTAMKSGPIGIYYTITKDEMQLIANYAYNKALFYFTSDKELKDSQVDENGNWYYEFTVKSKLNISSVQNAASCIIKK